jgi:hypothetical protein
MVQNKIQDHIRIPCEAAHRPILNVATHTPETFEITRDTKSQSTAKWLRHEERATILKAFSIETEIMFSVGRCAALQGIRIWSWILFWTMF